MRPGVTSRDVVLLVSSACPVPSLPSCPGSRYPPNGCWLSGQTTAEAVALLDAQFPWLAGWGRPRIMMKTCLPCADYCSAAWGWRMSGTTHVSAVRRAEKATFPEAARSLAANWPGRISGPLEPVKRSFDRKLVLTFSRAGDGSLTGLASEPLNSPNLSYVRGPHNSAWPFWVLPPNAPLHHGAQSRQGILRQCCPYHAKNSSRRLGQPSPVIAELCRAAEQFLSFNKAFQFAAGIEHWPSDRLRPSQPA